ncbi:hypothetical protein [Clostridium sp. DMHC 10]|nr:hypothetical protein [Clostridium sp. DMHC 10]
MYDGVRFIRAPAMISAIGRIILDMLLPTPSTLPLKLSGIVCWRI